MIGAYTVGKKAVRFGYNRYGVPGAVASGGVALVAFLAVRRALRSATSEDETDATLTDAIDTDRLRDEADLEDVGSSVSAEARERTGDEGSPPK
ncbi:hypothetical protein [Halobiforma nitratireducens]|uniref:Uncharacterized protein n=1 Tax=Halobiforma nitratireducens JCM 10879 TaxID=1227454 RepID=M0LNT7_9EURY|nr:hypothetical protein [Halobiforma nitratireducens]EMA35161.1 hypothetical protein C446_13114 [Halobiforma nitratireducens JCM 10879]